MINRPAPPWFTKAREFAARVASPVGKPCAVAKKGKTAELYLYEAIGQDDWFQPNGISPTDVVAALKEVSGADSLDIHINSPGGFVFDGVTIYNAIRAFEGPKTVYVDGLAASIASIIALAGDRVVTNEGALWMIHDPAGGVFSFGTADQIEDDARKIVNALRKIRETLLDIYVSNTGRALSDISAWMTAETWMTAAEAKERGFTDEITKTDPAEEEEEEVTARSNDGAVPIAASVSPRVTADLARAKARQLSEQFAAAIRGTQHPGPPGTKQNASPAMPGKGK